MPRTKEIHRSMLIGYGTTNSRDAALGWCKNKGYEFIASSWDNETDIVSISYACAIDQQKIGRILRVPQDTLEKTADFFEFEIGGDPTGMMRAWCDKIGIKYIKFEVLTYPQYDVGNSIIRLTYRRLSEDNLACHRLKEYCIDKTSPKELVDNDLLTKPKCAHPGLFKMAKIGR